MSSPDLSGLDAEFPLVWDPNAPTFDSRLREIEVDLKSIRDRLEIDRDDNEAAHLAHVAFHAVRKLRDSFGNPDLRWDWVPMDPDSEER